MKLLVINLICKHEIENERNRESVTHSLTTTIVAFSLLIQTNSIFFFNVYHLKATLFFVVIYIHQEGDTQI